MPMGPLPQQHGTRPISEKEPKVHPPAQQDRETGRGGDRENGIHQSPHLNLFHTARKITLHHFPSLSITSQSLAATSAALARTFNHFWTLFATFCSPQNRKNPLFFSLRRCLESIGGTSMRKLSGMPMGPLPQGKWHPDTPNIGRNADATITRSPSRIPGNALCWRAGRSRISGSALRATCPKATWTPHAAS